MHWPKLDMRYHLKYSSSCKLCGCKFVYAYLWLVWCMPLCCCILQRAHSNHSSDAVPLAWFNYTLDYIKCKCKDGWADCKDSHLPCWMGFHSFHTRTVRVESMSQTHLVQLHTHLALNLQNSKVFNDAEMVCVFLAVVCYCCVHLQDTWRCPSHDWASVWLCCVLMHCIWQLNRS